MQTVLIKKLKCEAVNQVDSVLLGGGPKLLAAHGYLTALAISKNTKLLRFCYVHHDREIRGVVNGCTTLPMMKKGNFLFGKDDFSRGDIRSGVTQKTIFDADLTVSLIAEFSDEIAFEDLCKFIETARFAGGIPTAGSIQVVENYNEAIEVLDTGFVFIRRDSLIDPMDKIGSLVKACSRVPLSRERLQALNERRLQFNQIQVESESINQASVKGLLDPLEAYPSFVAPAVFGYNLLTKPKQKYGSRNDLEHCYAEPMHGLGQYLSLSSNEPSEDQAFFTYEWTSSETIELLHAAPIESVNLELIDEFEY